MNDHRNLLLSLLKKYTPKYEEEIIYKQKIEEFIRKNPNCFERSLEEGHITGSSWLINKTFDKALLMHHFKLDKWLQLGGHADGCHNILEVAIKEAKEESGISDVKPLNKEIFDLDIHQIPANFKEKSHFHYDIRFLLQVDNIEETKINHEAKELRWIDKNREKLPTEEKSILRMFEKWLSL